MALNYEITTLPSGLRVISEFLPGVESVAVSLSVDVGARYESAGEGGISHLLEHMAFKGTETRTARQIAEEFDQIGGQFNAYTSLEHTVYYAKVLKDDLPLAMDIISDILLRSRFDESELKREQGVVVQEIAMHRDTPDDYIFDLYDEAAFPEQPLGRSILGTPERVESYTRDHLITYMQSHYLPARMTLSAAGNVRHADFAALAARYFAFAPAGGGERPQPGAYRGGDVRREDDLEQLHLMLGFPSFSVHDDDSYALQLFSGILGGGMSSRLFQEIREKRGLCYHVGSMVTNYSDCGMLSVYTATDAEQAAEVPHLLLAEIRKMADGVTDAELRRVKNQQKSELLMARENPGSVAGWLGKHLLVYGRVRDVAEITARIEAVEASDIVRVAERVLKGTPNLAALGPVGGLPEPDAISQSAV